MLVLTRKIGEVITAGDPHTTALGTDQPPVEITLLSVRGEMVEIGVEAPPETAIGVVKKNSRPSRGRKTIQESTHV